MSTDTPQTAAQTDTGAASGSAQAAPQGAQEQPQGAPQAPAGGGSVLEPGQDPAQAQAQAQAQPGSWRDSLPQDLRGHEDLKDIQDPAALAKAYVEARGKAPQVPAEYVISVPPGAAVDPAVAEAAKTLAREVGLTQPQLDALVRFDANRAQVYARDRADKSAKALESMRQELGAGAEAYFAQAGKGYESFASPELKELVKTEGLGNHPGLIRLFHHIGALVKEGKLPMGPGAGREKSMAELFYPDMPNG